MVIIITIIIIEGNFLSNHPGHDTLTSQISFIFSLFVGSIEMINYQSKWKITLTRLKNGKSHLQDLKINQSLSI